MDHATSVAYYVALSTVLRQRVLDEFMEFTGIRASVEPSRPDDLTLRMLLLEVVSVSRPSLKPCQ
jgi:hypothetical protein